MRGFEDDSITPTDANRTPQPDSNPKNNTLLANTIELRFPLLTRINLWGGLFFDVKALAESTDELNSRSFRTSAGLKIRYLLLGQVPLRLDVAFNLDQRCLTEEAALGSSCIKEPMTVPQFELLYTF